MPGTDSATDRYSRNEPPAALPSSVRETVGRTVARRQLTAFFVLAFAFTWLWDAAVYLFVTTSPSLIPPWTTPRTWGVPLAAIVVTWLSGGDLRAWARQVLDWRVGAKWFLLALTLPVAIGELYALIAGAAGHSLSGPAMALWKYAAFFVFVLLFAGALEEFGWRGFAQPRLQERYSAATGALVIGVLWACWHLPLFLAFDMAAYDTSRFLVEYLPWVVAQSVVFAWLFNATGGSVLPVMVIHASGNLAGFLQFSGELEGPVLVVAQMASPAVWWAIAIGLVLAYGTKYVAPRGPDPAIPGFPDTEPVDVE